MTGTLIWTDRLRIERAVWTLNSYLQTLGRRSQAAKRRELRVNLRAASADVGTKEAVRRLGNVHTMAADYIIAEYGGPRPSWWAATFVLLPGFWFMFWVSNARIDAFKGGVIAANPRQVQRPPAPPGRPAQRSHSPKPLRLPARPQLLPTSQLGATVASSLHPPLGPYEERT